MEYTKEKLEKMLQNQEMSSAELQALLKAREEGKVDFVLMDVREVFEFTDRSIKGADILLPTSQMNAKFDVLEALKEKPLVLYCRTGSRTGQVMYALRNMGFDKVVHLSPGIMGYFGETEHNAPIPNP